MGQDSLEKSRILEPKGVMLVAGGRRRRQFAVALIFGVTILVGGTATPGAGSVSTVQRYLAVDNLSGRRLLTVVTDHTTNFSASTGLKAGQQVRVYGVQYGRTIHAQRIELLL